jgi:hypothetical protein
MFYLTIFILCQFQENWLARFGSGTCFKPASFGLLCAWREVLILRQHFLCGFVCLVLVVCVCLPCLEAALFRVFIAWPGDLSPRNEDGSFYYFSVGCYVSATFTWVKTSQSAFTGSTPYINLKQLRIAVLYSCVLFACSASISLLNMVFGDKYEKFARKNISVSYPDKQIWTEIDGHSKRCFTTHVPP